MSQSKSKKIQVLLSAAYNDGEGLKRPGEAAQVDAKTASFMIRHHIAVLAPPAFSQTRQEPQEEIYG